MKNQHKKKKRSPKSNIGNAYKVLDLFGESINFTINGSSTHKGFCGAFVSMIILIIVASYAFDHFLIMWRYGDTSFQKVVDKNQILPTQVFT